MSRGATAGGRAGPVIAHRLRNGLTVLLRPIPSSPIVSVWCWYKVGSSDERPGITGMAHWLEHMNFKGTARFSKKEMKTLIDQRGGYWNAYTWIDQTAYFETLPKRHLDLALELEAERMARSRLAPADFESERTVILSELRGGENHPESLLDREVTAAVFRSHNYRWPTVGWERDVRRITREEMVEFYRDRYVPRNAALVVAGDFAPARTIRTIRRLFGGIPDKKPPRSFKTPESPLRGEKRVELEGGGRTTYLHVAFPAPSVSDPDAPVLAVLDAVLGGAKGINLWSYDSEARRSSPLYKKLIDGRLAAGVRSFYIPTRDPFLYYLAATVADGVPAERVEKRLLETLDRAASKRPGARELRKAKNQLRATVVFQSDSVSELAHQIGYYHTIDHGSFHEDFLARAESVSPEQVRDLAARLLTKRNRTVGVFRPVNGRGGG